MARDELDLACKLEILFIKVVTIKASQSIDMRLQTYWHRAGLTLEFEVSRLWRPRKSPLLVIAAAAADGMFRDMAQHLFSLCIFVVGLLHQFGAHCWFMFIFLVWIVAYRVTELIKRLTSTDYSLFLLLFEVVLAKSAWEMKVIVAAHFLARAYTGMNCVALVQVLVVVIVAMVTIGFNVEERHSLVHSLNLGSMSILT